MTSDERKAERKVKIPIDGASADSGAAGPGPPAPAEGAAAPATGSTDDRREGGADGREASSEAGSVAGAGAAERPSDEPGTDLERLLAESRARASEYLELAQRARADLENFRKRVANQAVEAETRGQAKVLREILPVIDNFERALGAVPEESSPESVRSLVDGVELVHGELVNIMERLGVTAYSPHGEPFDPLRAEAVSARPDGTVPPHTVVDVWAKGYELKGSVLRPAKVVVSASPPEGAASPAGAGEERSSSGS